MSVLKIVTAEIEIDMNHEHPKIYVAGHRGMVGAAIVRALEAQGQSNLVVRTHAELDLTNQLSVQDFLQKRVQIKCIWLLLK